MDRKLRAGFRPVNPMLGVQPKFGPFPAEQIIPWTVIAVAAYLICQLLLGLGWLWSGMAAAWGISTWWILTGDKPWRFLSKFTPTPYWVRGYCRYQSMLHNPKLREPRYEIKVRHQKHSHRTTAGSGHAPGR